MLPFWYILISTRGPAGEMSSHHYDFQRTELVWWTSVSWIALSLCNSLLFQYLRHSGSSRLLSQLESSCAKRTEVTKYILKNLLITIVFFHGQAREHPLKHMQMQSASIVLCESCSHASSYRQSGDSQPRILWREAGLLKYSMIFPTTWISCWGRHGSRIYLCFGMLDSRNHGFS